MTPRDSRPIKTCGRAAAWWFLLLALPGLTRTSPAQQDTAGMSQSHVHDNRSVPVVLTPRRKAVLSSEVAGRVERIACDLGESFDAGQTLVKLDDTTYQTNLRTAQAELTAAQEDLERVTNLAEKDTRDRHAAAILEAARATLTATERLHANGHASSIDLANARRDVEKAAAECELVAATTTRELTAARREVATARAQLAKAEQALSACHVAAPYAGRVNQQLVRPHEWVERGTPLVEIIADDVLRAKFLLPARLFTTISRGDTLPLHVRETGDTVEMKVTHIAASLDPVSETFEVYADVENAAGRLRSGMNGSLSLRNIEGP